MKSTTVLAALALTACASAASADLVITEIMAQTSAGTASAINGDWWELTNAGPAAVALSGYQWADSEDALGGAAPQPNFFPTVTINPGESIIILEEASTSEADWRANWGAPASLVILATDEMLPFPGASDTFSGLGTSGDSVNFYDAAGTLIDAFSYTGLTRGVSLELDATGADLGLSIAGENGAVLALNGDVGSPGYAVPAPSTAALLLLGAFTARRRTR